MPEFKEKPKMGQPKAKRSAMLDPRHRATLLKEKAREQLEQRQKSETESAEIQATEQVESAADWAVDELADHAPRPPRGKPPIKEKASVSDSAKRRCTTASKSEQRLQKAAEHRDRKSVISESASISGNSDAPADLRCFEARRQFVVDKQKEALLTERRIVRSDAIHPAAPNAEWTPAESPSWKEQPRREAFQERRRLR